MRYNISDSYGLIGTLSFNENATISFDDDLDLSRLPDALHDLYSSGQRDMDFGRMEKLLSQVILAFSYTVDAKDPYTNGHAMRVADYSREIARRSGFDLENQKEVYVAGLLHDIGKIGVPDAILNKKGKLTDEEFAVIKSHTVIGANILDNITEFPMLGIGARYHHEKYGGGGYPEGLSGSEIPGFAQIIAVADAYDAMTSSRAYRDLLPQHVVINEITKGKGGQFNPYYADIMLEMIAEDRSYDMHG